MAGSPNFTKETSGHSRHSGLMFVETTHAKIFYDSYTMVYHIDLSHYFEIKNMIKNYINITDIHCSQLQKSTCYVIIDSIKNQMQFMFRDEIDESAFQQNQIYSNPNSHQRNKRAIESIGWVYNWIFGLMDADSACEYDDKINSIISETEGIKFVFQNNTIFIKEIIGKIKDSFIQAQNDMKQSNGKKSFLISEINRLEYDLVKKTNRNGNFNDWIVTTKFVGVTQSTLLLKSLENPIFGKIN